MFQCTSEGMMSDLIIWITGIEGLWEQGDSESIDQGLPKVDNHVNITLDPGMLLMPTSKKKPRDWNHLNLIMEFGTVRRLTRKVYSCL